MTNQTLTDSMPFSQEAEEAVIGAVFINPNIFLTISQFLSAEDFYLISNGYIWRAMEKLHIRKEPVDIVTVAQELEASDQLRMIGGYPQLTKLMGETPTSAHGEIYGRIVERHAIRRKLLQTADEIKVLAKDQELSIDEVTAAVETRLFNVTDRQLKREFISLRDALDIYFNQIEFLMNNRQGSLGIPSGFRDLDVLLGGFQRSDLLIFAGRPGMGKCVAGETMVATHRGLVQIQSLLPKNVEGIPDNDGEGTFYPLVIDVQTPFGIQKTSHFYVSEPKPTLRIQTKGAYFVTGTHNHALLTITPEGQKVWKRLSELQMGDKIAAQFYEPDFDDVVQLVEDYYPDDVKALVALPRITPRPRFMWDEVTSIQEAGEQVCYDLTMPDGHAFIANGLVNHNTSFLLSTAMNVARLGGRVAIFTMEMGAEQLTQRMVSMETGINTQKLRIGNLSNNEYARLIEAAKRINSFPIYIDDTPALSPGDMRTKCRRLQHEYGIDMIIVDYMQLMNAGGQYQNNRVQEISYISRALKELARELNVPLFSAAQLSRAVEQRQDKRPVLSDLRESGCLAGETLIHSYDEGHYVPIRDLVGKTGFRVTSLNEQTWKLEPGLVTNAFSTGVKPVFRMTTRLGRSIRATGNHKFLTICGWKPLDELTTADHIAVPRVVPSPTEQTLTNAELALLGHLIGDGCTLPKHAIQYTTVDEDLAQTVHDLAVEVFGDKVRPRITKEKGRNWYQVFIPPTDHLTHGVYNPVRVWLEKLGVFGLRSWEKHIPDQVFQQPKESIALFLRHLWATDGCIGRKKTQKGHYPMIYYASSSEALATMVQVLLLRLEINARVYCVPQKGKGRDQYHVTISGVPDLTTFIELIGNIVKRRDNNFQFARQYISHREHNTNRDIIPKNIWRMYAVPAMQEQGITIRQLHDGLNTAHCGTTLYKQNVGRARAAKLADVTNSQEIKALANSDVYWDEVVSIEPDGEAEVFDLTVDKYHNFMTSLTLTHNSIEQDADIVMFLYRDVIYNEATEFPNQADVIIAKHRNGPTGTVSLFFDKTITKFIDGTVRSVDLGGD